MSELEETQGAMGYEGSPVKAPPNTRRRMMPPTQQQISHSSTDEIQWQEKLEAQSLWSIQERRMMAAMENYLGTVCDKKVTDIFFCFASNGILHIIIVALEKN